MTPSAPLGTPISQYCNRLARLLLAALLVACGPAVWAGPNVLVLWDDDQDQVENTPPVAADLNAGTQALVSALENAGISVSFSDFNQSFYNGTSPAPDNFDAVIHLNGNTTSTIDVMPTSTVVKLLNYVENLGGAIVTSENTEAQLSIPFVGLTVLMEDLMLLDREAGAPPPYGTISCTPAPGFENHPLLNGLTPPITFVGGRMRAQLRNYASEPAMVVLHDEAGLSAAAVRDFGNGRVVSFHHTGNFRSQGNFSTTLEEPNVQRLYINAVLWGDQHAPSVVSITKEKNGAANASGAPFLVTFSEGVTGLGTSDFQIQAQGIGFSPSFQIEPLSDRKFRVTVVGLSGTGTVRLNLLDDDSIVDESVSQNPLGGAGVANGGMTGPQYTVDAVFPGLADFTVSPLVVPIGERAEFTLHFDEAMDTAYSPQLRIVTDNDAIITASPSTAPPDNRVKTGLVALYTFNEGSGDTVYDRSGSGEALDLAIAAPAKVSWTEGGLSINSSTVLLTTGPATKIIDACKASNAFTMEAWIHTQDAAQTGPGRIATLSAGLNARNMTLEQDAGDYEGRVRTTTTSTNGVPELSAANTVDDTALQHVVFTRDAAGNETLYVDGAVRATGTASGDFSTWASNYKFAVGNELSQNRPWLGEFQLVAVYSEALDLAGVQQNFNAGPITTLPGDGSWLNSTTYQVSMDRAVVLSDQGGANVQVTGARDLAGNEIPEDTSNNFGIISSTLLVETQPDPFYFREVGEHFQFVVDVAGAIGGLQYQWYKESASKVFVPVGTNAPILNFPMLALGDSGTYYCVISDVQDSAQTAPSTLQVVSQLPLGASALLGAIAALAAAGGTVLRSRRARPIGDNHPGTR